MPSSPSAVATSMVVSKATGRIVGLPRFPLLCRAPVIWGIVGYRYPSGVFFVMRHLYLTRVRFLPSSPSSLRRDLLALFLGHGLETALAANLAAFTAYFGHVAGETFRRNRRRLVAPPVLESGCSLVDWSTIHFASWFGSRGLLPLPMVIIGV